MSSFTPVRAVACCLAVALASAPVTARAEGPREPTVTELLQRIEALERTISEMKRSGDAPCTPAAAPGGIVAVPKRAAAPVADAAASGAVAATGAATVGESASTSPAAPGLARPSALPVEDANAAASARPSKPLVGYKKGFFVKSADGDYRLQIGGYVQADSRWFVDDGTDDETDAFVVRRARFELESEFYDRFKFRLSPDFGDNDISLQEASVEVEFAPWAELRAGKFKTPFGIERLQSASDVPFVERALPNNLIPGRDIGARLMGDVAGNRLEYAIAVLNGVPDGSSSDEESNDSVEVAARLFATPWAPSMYSPLRGLGFGAAATYGREQGDDDEDELSSYDTSGRVRFFRWDGDTVADGDHWRVSPQMSWHEGPYGLVSEYVMSSQQVGNGDERGTIANQAWQVRANVMLTGEKATMDIVEPNAPFDFGDGHWGAWELGLRWASLDVDEEAFAKEFADPEKSARHADALALAVNWYLNRHVSFYLDYERTMFGGGAEDGDRPSEDVFLTRLQLKF